MFRRKLISNRKIVRGVLIFDDIVCYTFAKKKKKKIKMFYVFKTGKKLTLPEYSLNYSYQLSDSSETNKTNITTPNRGHVIDLILLLSTRYRLPLNRLLCDYLGFLKHKTDLKSKWFRFSNAYT